MRKAALSKLEEYLIPALVVAFFLLTTGAFFDASDDAVIALLMRGELGDYPVTQFPRFYFFVAPTIAYLYAQIPAVPWLGVFFVLAHYLISVAVLQLISSQFNRYKRLVVYCVYGVFVVLALSENLMFFNMNRVSILACATGIMLVMLHRNKNLGWGLFIIGMLVRPYGAILAVVLLLPMMFLLQKRRKYGQYIAVLVVFLVGYFGLFEGVSNFSQEQKIKNKLKSNVLDHGLGNDSKFSSDDSLLVEAVHQGFYQDQAITTDFLASYTGGSRWWPSHLTWVKVKRFFSSLWWSVSRNYQLLIILNFILLWRFKNRKAWWATCYLWVVALTLGVMLKLPEKLLSPILVIWTMILLWQLKKYFNKVGVWVRIIVIVFVLGYTVKIVHRTLGSKAIQQQHEAIIVKLNETLKDEVVYMTKFNYILNYLDPLKNYKFQQKTLVSITGWPTLLPQYLSLLSHALGIDSFKALWTHEEEGKGPVIIFNEEGGDQFLKQYCKRIHGIDISFVPMEDEGPSKQFYWPYQIQHVISTDD